jgi:signal peptidase II
MSSIAKRAALLLLICATIGCDRMTKHFAAVTLVGEPGQSFLADTVRLEYTENTGGFLGLGADWPPAARTALFTIGTGLMLLATGVAAVRGQWSGIALVGFSLFVAGGVSNLADRLARGSVIDFLNVGLGPLRTGIFNVADMAVMLGVCMLALAEMRTAGRPDPPSPEGG